MEKLSFIPKNIPAIIETTPNAPEWAIERVMRPANRSMENDGDIIYNGNDESFSVPTLGKTRSMFKTAWVEHQEMTSYPNATRMISIDIERIKPEEQEETLRRYLDKKTVDVWRSCKILFASSPQFTKNSAAVHIDCEEHGRTFWFEYIVNKTE